MAHWYQRGEGPFMSEKRVAELLRSLHRIIDAITEPNLRDLEAEARALTSSAEGGTSAKTVTKGKAKGP
jgi:hypothetical protein